MDTAKHLTTDSSVPTTKSSPAPNIDSESPDFRCHSQPLLPPAPPPEASRLVCVVSPAQASVLQPPQLCTPLLPHPYPPTTELYASANDTTSQRPSLIVCLQIVLLRGQALILLNVTYVMSLTSCTGEDLRRNPEITEPSVCSCPGGLQVGSAWPARGLVCFFLPRSNHQHGTIRR